MTYYALRINYYSHGIEHARIEHRAGEKIPNDKVRRNRTCYHYVFYFGTREEAQHHADLRATALAPASTIGDGSSNRRFRQSALA